ncbi:MAG TPA: invasion associated locus B family protein [Pseudorhodoplanes sp.]|nr:invasion associated locus B family protein [Pseudorhodoplanes sp.]
MWPITSRSAALLIVAMLVPAEARADGLIYSPWTKMCMPDQTGKQICFIGRDARLECGLSIVSAVLIESDGTTPKLRLAVPPTVSEDSNIRMAIDQGEFTAGPYTHSYKNGRMADYEIDANLVDQLKRGQMLTVEVVDSNTRPVTLKLPLAGFAQAYDAPSQTPKVYEEILSSEKMQELRKRSEEKSRKRAELLARAYRSGWPRCD